MKNFLKYIRIDEDSVTPKYLQVVNGLLGGITAGSIPDGALLPSIHDFMTALDVSKNTVERAYLELKRMGMVDAVARKGYFISGQGKQQKVLLLFNKLSAHKKVTYDAFVQRLGPGAATDLFVYHNDFLQFKQLLAAKANQYDKIVIIPHFCEDTGLAAGLIEDLPKDRLVLLDRLLPGVTGKFGAVYEDFENDIYGALLRLCPALKRYGTLKLVFPGNSYYAPGILAGFTRFCGDYAFGTEVVDTAGGERFRPGTAYITLVEDDLVMLVEKLLVTGLRAGRDIGLISYNETPVKKVILDGITTISTDFRQMGELAADLILHKSAERVPVPFGVVHRNSL